MSRLGFATSLRSFGLFNAQEEFAIESARLFVQVGGRGGALLSGGQGSL